MSMLACDVLKCALLLCADFCMFKKKKAWTPDFCLKKHSNCSFFFFVLFFCKTGCFSEATLLCNLSLSQNTFYSYDRGGWVSPPQYFTIPVVLKLHSLLLVVSALQWQHLISCCQTSSNFQFSPRWNELLHLGSTLCCMQPAVGFWMKAILLLQNERMSCKQ